EAFVRSLAVDRLCALIEPAMSEVGGPGESTAFAALVEGLRELTATPSGVGLDVPAWLRRLEAGGGGVRAQKPALAALVEDRFRVPRATLTPEDVLAELQEWEGPPEGESGAR